jgi:hypothetical protein
MLRECAEIVIIQKEEIRKRRNADILEEQCTQRVSAEPVISGNIIKTKKMISKKAQTMEVI